MLQQLVADRSMRPVNATAFAVTPTLRESYAEGDDDELADVALRDAALASLRLLAADDQEPGLPPRRGVVVVAEVDGATARPDLDDAVVRLQTGVTIDEVIAAYVDNADAESAVRAAIEAVDAADLGDEDSELIVGDAQDHDLAWYAPQELAFLVECSDDAGIRDRKLRYRRFNPASRDFRKRKVSRSCHGQKQHQGHRECCRHPAADHRRRQGAPRLERAAFHRRADHHTAAAR